MITLIPYSKAVIISPVHLDISVEKPISSFSVTNESDQVLTYQSNTLTWKQINGDNIYTATSDLAVTPPIASIPARSSQIFRVALFKKSAHQVEQAYRVILDDISVYAPEHSATGLSFIFNHNLPLFYAPLSSIDNVVWSICQTKVVGKSCLLMENKGNRHAKMIQFSAVSANSQTPNKKAKTVLAGSFGKWLFPVMQGNDLTTRIEIITDKGPLTLVVNDLPSAD